MLRPTSRIDCRFAGLVGFAALAALVVAPHATRAQDVYSTADSGGFSADIGGAVGVKPKYEGSNEYEAFGFPIVFPKFSNGGGFGEVKVRNADDVRLQLFNVGGFEFGPLAGYAFGRDEDDGDLLRGLGDVDDGLVLGAYAGYAIGPVLFDVSYHQIVTGNDDGYQIRFAGEFEQVLVPGTTGLVRAGVTFADDNYMESYFGISEAQAMRSVAGLPVYDADAGIKDFFFELGTVIALDERWTLRAGGKYARLVGDAADSPVVESENQFSAVAGLSYRFDFAR
jgi:MipA family protein